MKNKIQELYALEQLSGGNTFVHRLHPMVKLLTTIVFIIVVTSFDQYAFGRLVPYIFYPTLLMALSETPYSMLLKRLLIAVPFCLFAGITNVIFDRAVAFTIGNIAVSLGVVSLFTILFKMYLCVMAILILVSVTPFLEITKAMGRLRIPNIFITILELTYRYIGVLSEEAYSMYIAYSLRAAHGQVAHGQAGHGKGIAMRDMGSFAGQLLLRSFDRADRIYSAMKCRGYSLHNLPEGGRTLVHKDWIFLVVTCFLCVILRIVN